MKRKDGAIWLRAEQLEPGVFVVSAVEERIGFGLFCSTNHAADLGREEAGLVGKIVLEEAWSTAITSLCFEWLENKP